MFDSEEYYFVSKRSLWRLGFLCWLIGLATGTIATFVALA